MSPPLLLYHAFRYQELSCVQDFPSAPSLVCIFYFSLVLYHLLTCNRVLLLYIAKRYTNDHEWVEFDTTTGQGTVSITDYAQKSLGDVVFVELPTVGAEFAKGGPSVPRPRGVYTP